MKPEDAPILVELLTGLADALGVKCPGKAGLSVWYDVLRTFATNDVTKAFRDWARSKSKFPAPTEIAAVAAAMCNARLARDSQAKKVAKAPTPAGEFDAAEQCRADTARANLHRTLSRLQSRPRREPLGWARDLKVRHDAGEQLFPIQVAAYRRALGVNAGNGAQNPERPKASVVSREASTSAHAGARDARATLGASLAPECGSCHES